MSSMELGASGPPLGRGGARRWQGQVELTKPPLAQMGRAVTHRFMVRNAPVNKSPALLPDLPCEHQGTRRSATAGLVPRLKRKPILSNLSKGQIQKAEHQPTGCTAFFTAVVQLDKANILEFHPWLQTFKGLQVIFLQNNHKSVCAIAVYALKY